MRIEVGIVDPEIESLLGLPHAVDGRIFLGTTNTTHMRSVHPEAYREYGERIPEILANPDYVGRNPRDNSIEYVKEFHSGSEHIKVAVRLSLSGQYYARSLYVLNPNRTRNFIAKGTLVRPPKSH